MSNSARKFEGCFSSLSGIWITTNPMHSGGLPDIMMMRGEGAMSGNDGERKIDRICGMLDEERKKCSRFLQYYSSLVSVSARPIWTD
jgi:hypothetical protein